MSSRDLKRTRFLWVWQDGEREVKEEEWKGAWVGGWHENQKVSCSKTPLSHAVFLFPLAHTTFACVNYWKSCCPPLGSGLCMYGECLEGESIEPEWQELTMEHCFACSVTVWHCKSCLCGSDCLCSSMSGMKTERWKQPWMCKISPFQGKSNQGCVDSVENCWSFICGYPFFFFTMFFRLQPQQQWRVF